MICSCKGADIRTEGEAANGLQGKASFKRVTVVLRTKGILSATMKRSYVNTFRK